MKNRFTEKFQEEFWDSGQERINYLAATNLSLAFFLFAFIYYLHFFDPINYAKLLSEDQWGEYSTFACFLVGGILLFTLSFKTREKVSRLVWGIIGMGFLFIAFEEISWGQRIFNFPTPGIFLNQNLQKETTIHNLEFFEAFPKILLLPLFILIGVGVSLIIIFSRETSKKEIFIKFRLPYIPLPLIPLFLLIPYFNLLDRSLGHAAEIDEFLFGFAIAAWSADLFNRHGLKKPLVGFSGISLMITVFVVVGIVSETLAYRYPDLGQLGWRLNFTAVYDYARLGKYDPYKYKQGQQ